MTRRHGLAALAVLVGLAGVGLARRAMEPDAATVALSEGYPIATAIDTRTHRAFIEMATYTSFSSHLDVLDTASGRLVRALTLDRFPGGDLAIDERTNRAFVVDGAANTLRVFDARSGALLRTVALLSPVSDDSGQGIAQGIAVDTRTNRVFVGSTLYNVVQIFDARSGARLHTVSNAGDAVVADERSGRVYAFVTKTGASIFTLTILDARSGTLLHTVTLNQQPLQVVPSPAIRRVIVAEPGAVVILNVRTGRLLRTLPMASFPRIVSEMNGRVIVTSWGQHPTFIDVDAHTGRVVHTITLSSSANLWAIDRRRGRVFVSGAAIAAGRVWMIDARSGANLHTSTVAPNPGAIAVDERSDRVFVTSGPLNISGPINQAGGPSNSGSVIELDARSGRVLRAIPCGASSDALLMDEQAGRLMALCAARPAQPTDAWSWIPRGMRRWLHLLPATRPTSSAAPEIVHMLDATR